MSFSSASDIRASCARSHARRIQLLTIRSCEVSGCHWAMSTELPLIVSDMSQVTFSVGRGNSAIRGSPGSHNDNTPPNTSSATLHPRATAKACVYAATSCPDPSALKKTPPTIATPSAAPIWNVEMTGLDGWAPPPAYAAAYFLGGPRHRAELMSNTIAIFSSEIRGPAVRVISGPFGKMREFPSPVPPAAPGRENVHLAPSSSSG